MKRYNITNDTKGGIKAVESSTGHWMLAGEVERMLEDMGDDIERKKDIDFLLNCVRSRLLMDNDLKKFNKLILKYWGEDNGN